MLSHRCMGGVSNYLLLPGGCLNNLPAPASSPTQKHRSDAEDAIESAWSAGVEGRLQGVDGHAMRCGNLKPLRHGAQACVLHLQWRMQQWL